MFTIQEFLNRWDAAKAAGEDHVKISRVEHRDMYMWDVYMPARALHCPHDNRVFEGIPFEVIDVL